MLCSGRHRNRDAQEVVEEVEVLPHDIGVYIPKRAWLRGLCDNEKLHTRVSSVIPSDANLTSERGDRVWD